MYDAVTDQLIDLPRTETGHDIALLVQDKTGIIPDSLPLGDLIDIEEVGLRLAYDPS